MGLAFRMGFMEQRASRHNTDQFMGVDAERQCTPNLRGSMISGWHGPGPYTWLQAPLSASSLVKGPV